MSSNWNRLEEWLWRTHELRRMLGYEEEVSPLRSPRPTEVASETRPRRHGNAKGDVERHEPASRHTNS